MKRQCEEIFSGTEGSPVTADAVFVNLLVALPHAACFNAWSNPFRIQPDLTWQLPIPCILRPAPRIPLLGGPIDLLTACQDSRRLLTVALRRRHEFQAAMLVLVVG